jgi:hypothetical protein
MIGCEKIDSFTQRRKDAKIAKNKCFVSFAPLRLGALA